MGLYNLLLMTRPKLILLAIFLVASFPLYYSFACTGPACEVSAASPSCVCGFLPIDFFTVFVWSYVIACIIVEIYRSIRKKNK